MPLVMFAIFTDDELLRLARLKFLHDRGLYDEETIEHKRLLYLEWLYQSGRLHE